MALLTAHDVFVFVETWCTEVLIQIIFLRLEVNFELGPPFFFADVVVCVSWPFPLAN